MIRFLEKNYRKMEEIIRVLAISDKWMTKKNLQNILVVLSLLLFVILRRLNSVGAKV